MAWDGYITNLMAGTPPFVQEAAICGSDAGKESVWAATPGGQLAGVTVAEIKAMMSLDRSPLFASGLHLGGNKCTVLRDNLHTEEDNTLDVKMRPTATDPLSYSITIAKTVQTLIIVKGMKDIPGGKINIKASDMKTYLRKNGY
ncbi:profilin-1 [Oncorhynchus kisutch]|uniref:Profilin n=1 Tax=Oncorhynchus kisutch TaxID=8019 RepID=A0A8C7JM29_ONCKI|nr:profilin-1-like [Oncorhynchus kisutch]XP_031688561.1 profilin-1-like [Oncorhynchus kisutch]XP_031688563.1 profilin-1-like [Oncorhynchus kisutch]XP_031688564.1 profilin-1-like [Oncorhynchus kisutch]